MLVEAKDVIKMPWSQSGSKLLRDVLPMFYNKISGLVSSRA